MTMKISLKRNFLMNAILTMSSIIFPLLTFPYVSRILLPEGTGKVAFATSLISYFALFAQLGIPTYGIRACAKVRDNKEELTRTAHELLIINIVMCAVVYLIFFSALFFVPRLKEERLLYIIVSLTILFNSIGMEWLYKGLEQYTYITVRSLIFKIIALIAMFILIRGQDDYLLYGGLTIFAASASNVMNFVHSHKYIHFHPVGSYNFTRHLKAVSVFFAMACATTIYTHIDSTMLGVMVNDTEVGYYDASVKVKTALTGVVTSLGAVLLPRSSYYIQQGKIEEFKMVSKKAMNFVFLLAIPLIAYFIIFAKQSIYLLSGEAFNGSIIPMQIIMPTVFLIGITNILGIQILVPLGKEKIVLYSEIAGAVSDIIINVLLIPKMGASGAAIGTLAAETVVLAVQYAALHKDVFNAFASIHYIKILFAIILSSVSSILVCKFNLGNLLTIMISACLFFGIYGSFMIITREPFVIEILGQVMNLIRCKLIKEK